MQPASVELASWSLEFQVGQRTTSVRGYHTRKRQDTLPQLGLRQRDFHWAAEQIHASLVPRGYPHSTNLSTYLSI